MDVQVVDQCVGLVDLEPRLSGEDLPQDSHERAVSLQRDAPSPRSQQVRREVAQPRPDLDDPLALREDGGPCDGGRDTRVREKVLTQPAPGTESVAS